MNECRRRLPDPGKTPWEVLHIPPGKHILGDADADRQEVENPSKSHYTAAEQPLAVGKNQRAR